MAQIARITTWASGQILTAAALNSEFNNIITAWNNIDSASASWTSLGVTNNATVGGTLTVTGATTFNNRINNISNSNNGNTLLTITNSGSGASADAEVLVSNGTSSTYLRHNGTGNTTTLYGLTLAGYAQLESDASANGLLINTLAGSMYIGTVSTKALQIDTSQNVIIPNTKLQCGGNQVFPIVQVVSATSTTASSKTSSTFADTNLTVSITPKFSTSKIYVTASGILINTTSNVHAYATIARGGTNLLGSSGGQGAFINGSGITAPCFLQVYDSPSSTSAQAYSVQIRNSDNTSTVTFGESNLTQYITAMEIAQ